MSAQPEPEQPPEPDLPAPFHASICPGPHTVLPEPFVTAGRELERLLKMPVWFLIQDLSSEEERDSIGFLVEDAFFESRHDLPRGTPVALVIHSPGGYAKSAYQIAMLLRKRCGGFTAVIPRLREECGNAFGAGCR
jgi:hypothetical protein